MLPKHMYTIFSARFYMLSNGKKSIYIYILISNAKFPSRNLITIYNFTNNIRIPFTLGLNL